MMLVLAFALVAMPVGIPATDGVQLLLKLESVSVRGQSAHPPQTCARRILVCGTEVVSAGVAANLTLLGGLFLGGVMAGFDDEYLYRVALWTAGTYATAVPLAAATSAWGTGRLFGDRRPWGRAFVGSLAGEVAGLAVAVICGQVDPSGPGLAADIAGVVMGIALLGAPSIGAVIGLNL